MRPAFVPALLVAAVLVTLALAPATRAQPVPSLTRIENFRVSAVDADGNGRFDALVATFNTNVTVAGNFRFRAQLSSLPYNYSLFLTNNTDVNLAIGPHDLRVSIPGPAIVLGRTSGPYTFELHVFAISNEGQFIPYGTPAASASTPAYNVTDFEPPGVSLGAPITDAGVDTDGDGLFNYLVLHVPVVVTRATSALVQGCIGCIDGGYYSSDNLPTEFMDLSPGTHILDLRWDGIALRSRFPQLNGPLSILVSLYVPGTAATNPLLAGQTLYTTSRYAGSGFETPYASLPPGTPAQTLRDTNGNGLADFLVLHIPVDVRVAGRYLLEVMLSELGDPNHFAIGGTWVSLPSGSRTVDVSVSGIALSRFTSTSVRAAATLARGGSFAIGDTTTTTWVLPSFFPSDFESRAVSTLTLNLPYGNTTCGIAYAYDPANRFLAYSSPYAYLTPGQLRLDLYDGTFDVLIMGCAIGVAGSAQKVTVLGPTTVDVPSVPPTRPTIRLDYSVPAWNETDVTTSEDLGPISAFYRLVADFFGNVDGFADAAELRDMAQALSFSYVGAYYLPSPVRADNRTLPAVSARVVSIAGAGDIVSPDPIRLALRTVYRTANLPVAGDHHGLVIETPYSSPANAKYEVTVTLAASLGGNLSVRSRMVVYDGDGFTWPANATVSRTGTRSWSIDVGDLPGNQPPSVDLEITADAYGAAPPAPPGDLVGYLANPLSVSLILVALAAAVMYIASRRRKTPKTPT